MNEIYGPFTLTAPVETLLAEGECIVVAPQGAATPLPSVTASGGLPVLRAGVRLGQGDEPCDLVVESVLDLPGAEPGSPAVRGVLLRALHVFEFPAGALDVAAARPGMAVAVVILSDKGSRGERVDECAPIIEGLLADKLPLAHVRRWIIPDDPATLKALLADLCLTQGYDLVLTSGGTGVAPARHHARGHAGGDRETAAGLRAGHDGGESGQDAARGHLARGGGNPGPGACGEPAGQPQGGGREPGAAFAHHPPYGEEAPGRPRGLRGPAGLAHGPGRGLWEESFCHAHRARLRTTSVAAPFGVARGGGGCRGFGRRGATSEGAVCDLIPELSQSGRCRGKDARALPGMIGRGAPPRRDA